LNQDQKERGWARVRLAHVKRIAKEIEGEIPEDLPLGSTSQNVHP
jgi:hypothetical protein